MKMIRTHKIMLSLEDNQFNKTYDLRTHPGRVTMKDASMEGIVRPLVSVQNGLMAVGKHSRHNSFPNPKMHERRPNPLRFYRQKKFFQSACHRSPFARSLQSQTGLHNGIVARHPFYAVEQSASSGTSV